MRAADFAQCVRGAQQRGSQWSAFCPAHDDERNRSLSFCAGDRGVIVHCFAGCSVEAIAAACGLTVRDLFYDNDTPCHLRKPVSPKPRLDLNATAFRLRFHSDLLYLRAHCVLGAAASLDVTTWGDDALARAVNSVASAYADLERVALLDGVAFTLRCRLLKTEMHYAA